MNKLSVKIIAFALCAVLCLSGVITAFALAGDKSEESEKNVNAVSTENKEKEDIPKDETVYVLAGADGSVKKIAGATGKVSIRFDYDNKQYETVKIDEKDEKIKVTAAVKEQVAEQVIRNAVSMSKSAER